VFFFYPLALDIYRSQNKFLELELLHLSGQ
jgi:hypothetical protein